jgi:hypothetical protein
MFDHYKRVSTWIIMACHVYNPIYVRVIIIAVYDMQSKDIDSQILMWRALMKVMKTYGFDEPYSRGLWLIVLKRIGMLFELCLAHQETHPNHCPTKKTCLFHWVRSMEIHINKLIQGPDL